MKLLLFLIVIWAGCAVITPARRDITFDLTLTAIGNIYNKPIQVLRTQTRGSERFGISVLRNPTTVPANQRFILVDIIAARNQTITLVIQVTDLYLLAYADRDRAGDRISLFQGVDQPSIRALFPGATARNISVNESYVALERIAGGRDRIDLGIIALRRQITDRIFGREPIIQRDEAIFILMAVQMVSEAARFKYIENQVKTATPSGTFRPNNKTINLQNNWDNISGAIQRSTNRIINPALQLRHPNNSVWTVNNVDQIAPDLGILKFRA